MIMPTQTNAAAPQPVTIKDLQTINPLWCAGCGDFGVTMGLKRFIVDKQLQPHITINVSGIGCSGRAPNYYNTYGVHGIHGRAIPLAMGIALTRPDLNLFVHSGDGDALSIGGNHLIHGVNKNFKCVFILYDNELYALTKNQSSPTTRKSHPTNTQPQGTYLDPLNAVRLVLGMGGSFVASTADWMPDHLANILKLAFDHKGFAFIHISQRCPHFDPNGFDHKTSNWFSFLAHEKGVPADKRLADKTEVIQHDPSDLQAAFKYAADEKRYYGIFYVNKEKPSYDEIMRNTVKQAKPKERKSMMDKFVI